MNKETALYIFGLSSSATEIEIKKRYKELAKKIHPDIGNGDEKLFIVIQETYEQLIKNNFKDDFSYKYDFTYSQKEDIVTKKRREQKERQEKEREENINRANQKTRVHVENIPTPLDETEVEFEEKPIFNSKTDIQPDVKSDIPYHDLKKEKLATSKFNKNIINIKDNTISNITEENITESISYEDIIKKYSIEFSIKELQELAKTDKISKFYELNNKFYELSLSAGDVFFNTNCNFYLKDILIVKQKGQTKQYVIRKEISEFINTVTTVDIAVGRYNLSLEFGSNKKTLFVNKKKKNFEKVVVMGNGFDETSNKLLNLDTIMLKIYLK